MFKVSNFINNFILFYINIVFLLILLVNGDVFDKSVKI